MKFLSTILCLLPLASAFPADVETTHHGHDRRPLVESNKLRRSLTRSALLRQADKLQSFASAPGAGGTRGFGGQGHNATINYIYNEIKKLDRYYDVYLQPFTERYSAANGTLTVDGEEIVFYAARGSPVVSDLKTGLAPVKGEGCNVEDFGPEVEGNIALLMRGNCTITYKAQLAGAAGAKAVIVYNSVTGTVLDGRLLDAEGIIPTGAIANDVGLEFISQLEAGEEFRAELSIDSFAEDRVTYNVVAQTKSGNPDKVIVVGGHSDSVPLGPGINDNGSGTIGLLEIALKLAKFKVNNAIRFIWFSAEEYGLLGAHYYVSQLTPKENLKIASMTNVDMIGSPNYVLGVYDGDGSAFGLTGPAGSDLIEHTLEAYFKSVGKESVPTAFTGRSDYGPFLDANIPAGGLFTGAEGLKTEEEAALFGGEVGEPYDANYHQPGDTTKNLDLGALIENTKAIADLVAKYGRSLKGFPKRTLPEAGSQRQAAWSEGTHGKNHDHSAAGGCGDGLY